MTVELSKPAARSGRAVNADMLVAAPEVLGQPLAEPRRRLAAMLVDLAVVGLLSVLSAPWLGLGMGTMLIVLFGNAASAPLALKIVRTACRALGGLIILVSVLALTRVSFLREGGLHLDAFRDRGPSAAMRHSVYVAPDASPSELRRATAELEKQVSELKAENRQLHEAGLTWVNQARAFTNTLGITFGWSGLYFTLVAGALGGRTLGKLLLRTRAVKVNGTQFTFFDAFVRHGGYVAGVAMGLTGFLKLLWEPNRQAVQDRIASTVVVKTS